MVGGLDQRAAGAKRLSGKVCIVTGAGQGIGRATAKRLGEEGGKIVVAERIEDLRDQHNVQYYTAHFSYGSMEHDKVMRSMKLFADEVMPKFR